MAGVIIQPEFYIRLEVHGKEFFIDLLLYNRQIKSLIALELKVGELQPEYVGKMQFYLRALDEQVRVKDENFETLAHLQLTPRGFIEKQIISTNGLYYNRTVDTTQINKSMRDTDAK